MSPKATQVSVVLASVGCQRRSLDRCPAAALAPRSNQFIGHADSRASEEPPRAQSQNFAPNLQPEAGDKRVPSTTTRNDPHPLPGRPVRFRSETDRPPCPDSSGGSRFAAQSVRLAHLVPLEPRPPPRNNPLQSAARREGAVGRSLSGNRSTDRTLTLSRVASWAEIGDFRERGQLSSPLVVFDSDTGALPSSTPFMRALLTNLLTLSVVPTQSSNKIPLGCRHPMRTMGFQEEDNPVTYDSQPVEESPLAPPHGIADRKIVTSDTALDLNRETAPSPLLKARKDIRGAGSFVALRTSFSVDFEKDEK
ncbi:hypothetical protein BDK51DRAFT_36925 [Blyttiomyces helicus]|uniref:Uncharacterized protein n=1 Tax=Blyttiomyces helicus TaxID=388810 RepID=A0A4P9WLU8_9FUNG|nr:hypothetical protein BDK51DRAFT_36925 [Blyttiomyces helicus]|eukprot:RKO94019.1 hypothetical protein BDK51DRAFT_36925 [Blyttiomyces helicus]